MEQGSQLRFAKNQQRPPHTIVHSDQTWIDLKQMKKYINLCICAGLVLVGVFGCAPTEAETPGANPTSTESNSGMTAVPQDSVGTGTVPPVAIDGDSTGK